MFNKLGHSHKKGSCHNVDTIAPTIHRPRDTPQCRNPWHSNPALVDASTQQHVLAVADVTNVNTNGMQLHLLEVAHWPVAVCRW